MKIDSCIIIKNEEEYLKKLITNLLKFSDNVYIVDTGSTDNSINVVNMMAMENSNVHLEHFKWIDDFGAARNFSFDLSKDSDYRFWCDASDDFNEELINKLIEFKNTEYSDDLYDAYAIDRIYGGGNVRIIGLTKRTANIKWHDRIHEYLSLYNKSYNDTQFTNGPSLIHKGYYNRKPGHESRNLKIFTSMDLNHDIFSSRNLLYYGNELYDHQRYILAYSIYLVTKENYDNFLSNAELITVFCKLRVCAEKNKNQYYGTKDEVIEFGRKLYNKGLRHRLLLYILGTFYFENGNYTTAIRLYKESINAKPEQLTRTELIGNEINVENALLQLVVSYDKLNDQKTAKYYNDVLLNKNPNNKAAQHNKKYFEACLFNDTGISEDLKVPNP